MWSQSSVAPWYCKMNPAPSLLETAREIKAVDRLPIPWSCALMTDALLGDIRSQRAVSPQRAAVHVRWRSNFWPTEPDHSAFKRWVLGCVYLLTWWSGCWGGVGHLSVCMLVCWDSQTSWYIAPLAVEWKETSGENNQYERSTTKNEKQMLKSTQGHEDELSSQGS